MFFNHGLTFANINKMNLFLEGSIQHKWMKKWEKSYWFKKRFCKTNMNYVTEYRTMLTDN